MADLPKKKPAPAEKRKREVLRNQSGGPVLAADKGKKKAPMGKAVTSGSKGKAYKILDAYNKGGYVKGKGMACGGMTKKGKK